MGYLFYIVVLRQFSEMTKVAEPNSYICASRTVLEASLGASQYKY